MSPSKENDREELTEVRRPLTRERESFDGIYLNLSELAGACRFAMTGVGWKVAGGTEGATWTLDKSLIGSGQWSRAARGYEVKILPRNSEDGIVQLDGFKHDVSSSSTMSAR